MNIITRLILDFDQMRKSQEEINEYLNIFQFKLDILIDIFFIKEIFSILLIIQSDLILSNKLIFIIISWIFWKFIKEIIIENIIIHNLFIFSLIEFIPEKKHQKNQFNIEIDSFEMFISIMDKTIFIKNNLINIEKNFPNLEIILYILMIYNIIHIIYLFFNKIEFEMIFLWYIYQFLQ